MDDAGRIELVIVDDEPELAELLGAYVEDEPGVVQQHFADAKSALAYMIANDRARLLITDYRLPCMDGIELADTVCRFQARPIKVAILSGYLVRGFVPDEDFDRIQEKYELIHKPWRSDITVILKSWLNELKIQARLAE